MPIFEYTAVDRNTQKEVKGTVEAISQQVAITDVKNMGLLPISVKEPKKKSMKQKASSSGSGGGGGFGGGIKPLQVTDFTSQLSTLIDAGLPIVQSLQILTDMQKPGKFKGALLQVTDEVQSGTMLSEAFSHHPKAWDKLYTNMIKAGETAGALEAILRRLASFREKAQRLKQKIKGALMYPMAVTIVAVGIITFIMIVIVPKFEKIFREMSIDLPQLTILLIKTSRFIGEGWWIILIGIVAIIVGAKILKSSDAGGAIIDRIVLKMPVAGSISKKSAVARFTRTLGTLVTSGVGFLDALEITRTATPNVVVRNAIADVRDAVKEGETINEPLARSGVFNDIVVNMIKVGEETGELDKMLVKIADNYDEEVDDAVNALMSMMEPILIVFMGAAVGLIVVALFMPLIKVIEGMQ